MHRTDNAGWTALHYSARFGYYESVAFFAGLGIDINLNTNDGKNCLYIAAIHGHINLCKALINERNFDMHMANNDGWVALHFSARNGSFELVTFFTSVGIDVNLKTNDEKNCLHIAALYGHLNLCKKLKDKFKLDVHITDNDGWTALHFSARNGSYELVPYFVELKIDIQLKANDGKNCLHIAALYGHLNLCKIFVDKHRFNVHDADNDGWTALHYSTRYGSYDLVTFFVDMGIDIHLKTNDGKNCLHIAALYGHLKLCVEFIEVHKFGVLLTDNNEWTALHCSAENGSFNLFSYILGKGEIESEVYCKTNCMKNVLHLSSRNGHLDFVNLFWSTSQRIIKIIIPETNIN